MVVCVGYHGESQAQSQSSVARHSVSRLDWQLVSAVRNPGSERRATLSWLNGEDSLIGLEFHSESHSTRERIVDGLIILVIFALYAASPPPDVNEAHYLTKARQFWNPNWLSGDLFLASGFSHWLFYVAFGWLSVLFDLPTSAWIGRMIVWALLAWGWESLVAAAGFRRLAKVFATVCFLAVLQVGNLSGEWVVGGIEAKVPAYALVFFALANAIHGRWNWVWPTLGLATGFHPLVGGWSLLACVVARIVAVREQRIFGSEIVWFAVGIILGGILGVFPAIAYEQQADLETRSLAAAIYVRERINHHVYFWDFARGGIVGFAVTVIAWRELRRRVPRPGWSLLNAFAMAALLFVVAGIALSSLANVDWAQDWANARLRFYWFRLADVALPMVVSFGLVEIFFKVPSFARSRKNELFHFGMRWVLGLAAVCICAMSVAGHWMDRRPGADRQSLPAYADSTVRTWETYRNWVRVCDWIRTNTPADAVFLTPRQQQTFKWYAQRVEYVNWKDMPQDPMGIVLWQQRMTQVFGSEWNELQFFVQWPDAQKAWLEGTGAKYIVIEQEIWNRYALESDSDNRAVAQIYPADPNRQTTYVVLEVN